MATHGHRDHIRGFETGKRCRKSGDIIAALEPKVVVQPWTEDPKAKTNATAPTDYGAGAVGFAQFLSSMETGLESMLHRIPMLVGLSETNRAELRFLGENNIANKSAVKNLIAMGNKGRSSFVYCGSKSGLEDELPGLDVHVLGPPTLEQSRSIRSHRDRDPDEFWHLKRSADVGLMDLGSTGFGLPTAEEERPRRIFPNARWYHHDPPWSRWFARHIRQGRSARLLRIVRSLDDSLNNTSVILFFKVKLKGSENRSMSVLFPGDAQIENWRYGLDQREFLDLLKEVNVYKVGHHGILNGTPNASSMTLNLISRTGASRMAELVPHNPMVHVDDGDCVAVFRDGTLLVDASVCQTA